MGTSPHIKPSLDTIPNELIQKIWSLSINPYLLLVSRKIYSSLNSEHVQKTFWRSLTIEYFRKFLPMKPAEEYSEILERDALTSRIIYKALEDSRITALELWDIFDDLPQVCFLAQSDGCIFHKEEFKLMTLTLPRQPPHVGIPSRLLYGKVRIRIQKVNNEGVLGPIVGVGTWCECLLESNLRQPFSG